MSIVLPYACMMICPDSFMVVCLIDTRLDTHRTEAVTSLCIISCTSNCRPQAVRDHTRSDSSRTRTPSMSTILYQTHSQRDHSPLLTNSPKMPNSAYALVPHSNYFSLYATSCNEKDSPSRCTPREAMPQEPTSTCLCCASLV